MGKISLRFDAGYTSNGRSDLCVYGWTINPLVEWYIVECYTERKPPYGLACIGVHEVDGCAYNLYSAARADRPSILGINSFNQFWNVRTSPRSSGIVDVSAHLRAWERLGLTLGDVAEVSLSIEGFESSGNAKVLTNVLIITPE